MHHQEYTDIYWPADRAFPTFQEPHLLDIYDIRGASQAVQLSITALAGLINRPQPRLYLIASDDDVYWLNERLHRIPQEMSPARNDAILEALLTKYRAIVKGMIIYDLDCPDSINVATMMAGIQDGLVVSPDQVQHLQSLPDLHNLPILADLRTHRWRSRRQVYDWARRHLLKDTTPRVVAGLNPATVVGLRSFLVATRAFIYWLSPVKILPAVRSRGQSERSLMQQILRAYSPGSVHLGWFSNESAGVTITSELALPVLASDHFSNLEVWTSIKPASTVNLPQPMQARGEQPAIDPNKIYLSFTISDGDNLQYNQHRLLRLWRDPARGTFPLGWTTSPVLQEAAPDIAAYYRETATPNDELLAGPSGAGYMYPSHWPLEHLPSFLERTGKLMQAMGLTTLEVFDVDWLQSVGMPVPAYLLHTGMPFRDATLQQRFAQALSPFGIQGIVSGDNQRKARWKIVDGIPLYQNLGIALTVKNTIDIIKQATARLQNQNQRPLFLSVYILAWRMHPSDLQQVIQALGDQYEIVTPGKLLAMIVGA